MGRTALGAPTKKRTASKQERQLQLIRATIRSVAKNGLADTTMSTVAREAGLSQGIINLHFQSKDRLLVETLRYIADEYKTSWEKALDDAGPSPAERLAALVEVDFNMPVCDRNKLAVWFAFWGESKSRPTYRKLCATRDIQYRKELGALCQLLIEEGGYQGLDAMVLATGLSAMAEGLWLDLLISPRSLTREQARNICLAYLASAFPRHFSVPPLREMSP
ncbi:MAG: transcriptional regulator BetI [Proteobacteria bacterium]|nr:transcriptional regulator BetI [Pseudomonadota bacterium]